ncbi:MAG: hypothetical protein Q9218_003405 [Villophora microphyllina]
MEPISATASCLALLEAAIVVSKAATVLYHNISDAPKELAHLSSRILQTQSRLNIQLQTCQSLSSYDLDSFFPTEALELLDKDLNDAKTILELIQSSSSIVGKPNATQRVLWALHDKRKVKKVLEKFHDIDKNLCAMLTTLSV